MGSLWVQMFWPEAVGLVAAILVLVIRRRHERAARLSRDVRAWTLVAVVLGLVFLGARTVGGLTPLIRPPELVQELASGTLYTGPLIAGLIAVALLALPVGRRTTERSAVLERRTVLSYVRPWSLVAVGVVLVTILLITVAAGLVSRPDEQGLWRLYEIDHGVGSVGTWIYGWYFSVPCLVLTAAMLALASAVLATIARPALAADAEADAQVRRWRSRAVVGVTAGALLLHLSVVLGSLSNTLLVRGGGSSGQVYRSTVAPLAEPLRHAGDMVAAGGWFLWFLVLAAAVAAPRRARVDARSGK